MGCDFQSIYKICIKIQFDTTNLACGIKHWLSNLLFYSKIFFAERLRSFSPHQIEFEKSHVGNLGFLPSPKLTPYFGSWESAFREYNVLCVIVPTLALTKLTPTYAKCICPRSRTLGAGLLLHFCPRRGARPTFLFHSQTQVARAQIRLSAIVFPSVDHLSPRMRGC